MNSSEIITQNYLQFYYTSNFFLFLPWIQFPVFSSMYTTASDTKRKFFPFEVLLLHSAISTCLSYVDTLKMSEWVEPIMLYLCSLLFLSSTKLWCCSQVLFENQANFTHGFLNQHCLTHSCLFISFNPSFPCMTQYWLIDLHKYSKNKSKEIANAWICMYL